MNTAKRITIQFILVCLIRTLKQADEDEYRNAIRRMQQSRLPTFLVENIIRTTNREEVIT